jgi:hypothetical protein
VALRDVVHVKPRGGARDHHVRDHHVRFEAGGLVATDASLELLQAPGRPREELDPANRSLCIDCGPLVAEAIGELGGAPGPHPCAFGILVRDQQLPNLAVGGQELPGWPERLEDRHGPQCNLLRLGQHASQPDKLGEPLQSITLAELVTELDVAIERSALRVHRGLELRREKALAGAAFEQLGARGQRDRGGQPRGAEVQRGSLAMRAELRRPRRRRGREAQHCVCIVRRLRVVGETSKIRRAVGRSRERGER